MFEYFSRLYSGLVNDIIGKKTKSKKYTADAKKRLMTSVVRLISDARIGVAKASVLSAQDAVLNDLCRNLNDISGLLYKTEVKVSEGESSLLSASALKTALSCLYSVLEDIVKALCDTQLLSPQTHPLTFLSVSEKLENVSAGIAHAIVALQDYSATLTKKKELGRFDDVTVNSARRAVFLVTCVMVNICGPYATSPAVSYPSFGAMAAAIESAVAISKLISPNTPSFMRTRAAEIAVRKFNAVRNNCHDYIVRANADGTRDVSEIFVDVPTIFINLVSKYTDPDFAKNFVKDEASEKIPDHKEVLLLEGMFYASYAVFLCKTSKHLESSIKDEERTEISDHIKTLLDSFYGCYHAYHTVRSTTNRTSSDVSADTLMQGLHRIVDVAEQLGTKYDRVLPRNIIYLVNTIAICAHRSLDMLSKSESSYSCIWSKSVLPLFPNELPETLKEKHVKGSTGDNSRVYCLISDKKIRSKLSERTIPTVTENQRGCADLKFSKQATHWGGEMKPCSYLNRQGLHRIVDVAEQLGTKYDRVLPRNIIYLVNTIAICAHRSLYMLSKSESPYSCIWSKSVLPLFPNELPETLKEKHVKESTGDNSRVSERTIPTVTENQRGCADLKFSKQATHLRGEMNPCSYLNRSDSGTDEGKTLYTTEVTVAKVGCDNPSPIYDTVTPEPYLARGI